MNPTEYRRIIQELCEHVGIADVEKIIEAQHMEVDNAVVGLIYDDERAPDTLNLYFSLGHATQANAERRLLETNALSITPEAGYFCILPEDGSVVYRVNMPLTHTTNGPELAAQIETFLKNGRQILETVVWE